jgi:hypothetical protein
MRAAWFIGGLCLFISACGGNSSGSPTNPTPTPQTPTVVSLTGTVSAITGGGIVGATVRIGDGANAGKTTQTTAGGSYRFDGLTASDANISASAAGYEERAAGVYINGTNTLNFTLRPPTFTRSGVGDTVFDMPTYVSRIRIQAQYAGFSENFIVHVGGRHIVNELLGTGWGPTTFDGTYVTTGGVTEILHSTRVSWWFTEVR